MAGDEANAEPPLIRLTPRFLFAFASMNQSSIAFLENGAVARSSLGALLRYVPDTHEIKRR